ncbi:LOW QUALITY PROTEIN: kanadaptin [Rhopalosiphum maidis]|uniref:LOW QUALITY PROTEIN: kanadaptin n=1 Tax=Rhopalosiphum maidis TaxID=43146 RepID=UPI000EFE2D32|nr:LOW QUALITY PROTEIN: kanadaptin [Rhopalosiphum maidis]
MDNEKEGPVFKVPKLFGPRPGTKKPVICEDNISNDSDVASTTNVAVNTQVSVEQKIDQPKKVSKATSQIPIPYEEPSWGGKPGDKYFLEELKSGVMLSTIQLESRSFHCFGRLNNCHVTMAHPTISRFHAVLQYRSTFSTSDENRGFYLYDLDSTHGTFLNRLRIKPKTYVKVHVGHLISFGGSTRMYLLQGPTDDEEKESELTVTELKAKRQAELEQREREQELQRLKREEEERKKMEQGVDWGMGEDANEEEDTKENPFAPKENEQLYLDDPKKTLKGWFEREGQELEYDVSEKGFGTFTCRIELPIANITGRPQIAEATISGKKKEAIAHCALEACKILDMYGLLRQSTHESRKRKEKNWEEEDFYDSDDDNFLDRTGDIDAKRKKRMKKFGKTAETVDTYETLMEKHKLLIADLKHNKNKLNRLNKNVTKEYGETNDEDSLESYMSDLRNYKTVDKIEIKRLKIKINELQIEEEKLRKIINIVRPTTLPELTKPQIELTPKVEEAVKVNPKINNGPTPITSTIPKEVKKIDTKIKPNVEEKVEVINKEKSDLNEAEEKVLKELKEAEKRQKQLEKKDKKIIAKTLEKDKLEDFGNMIWKPPADQTGDGRTSLNEKYGY